MAGVACMTVASHRTMRPASAAPSSIVSRAAMTTHAPRVSGRKISNAAISNASVVMASIVSSAPRAGCRSIDASRLTTERCSISTPLGSLVEPEV